MYIFFWLLFLIYLNGLLPFFFFEATLSESVKVCPYPLLMIACQLLLEITSFLRESHGLYSVTKPTYRPLHRYIVPRRRQSVTSHRRSIVLSPETQQRRLSSLFGGGGERIRRASVLSQASVQTEFNSSPSRTLQEPPMITVSETDPGSTKLEAPDQEGKRERRDSTGQAGNRSSLYFPRQSAQHSPKTAKRIARRSAVGGEGESVRFRSKSTKCDSKHLSVDANVVDDDDESDDEDPTANLPWLSAVIQLNSLTAFLCDHQGVCHLNCHQRQSRSCTRMVQALKTVYRSPNKVDKIPERGLTKVVSSALISAPQMGSAEQVSMKQKDDEEMTTYISSNVSHDIDVPCSRFLQYICQLFQIGRKTPSVLIPPLPFQTLVSHSSVARVSICNVIESSLIWNAQTVFFKYNNLTTPWITPWILRVSLSYRFLSRQ